MNNKDFINKARMAHGNKYDYSLVNYKNAKSKVAIICPIHGIFYQQAYNHYKGIGCPKCGIERTTDTHRFSIEEFIKKSNKIHGNKYDYSKVNYINGNTKVCIVCHEHGDFMQNPSDHMEGKGCPKCGHIKCGYKKRLSTNEFISKSKSIHGDKYDYSKTEYITAKHKVIITCRIHGDFYQSPFDHLSGKGCKKCCNENRGMRRRKIAEENFIDKARKVHGDKYNYDKVKYIDSHTKIIITCPKHGDFTQTPTHHLSGLNCPKCRESIGERFIRTFLDDNKIEYLREYKILNESIISERHHLFIDFYIPKYRTFIEFNGIQHYKIVEAFKYDSKKLEEQQRRDEALKQYCIKHKINLLVIKYTEINKVLSILTAYFEKLYKNSI